MRAARRPTNRWQTAARAIATGFEQGGRKRGKTLGRFPSFVIRERNSNMLLLGCARLAVRPARPVRPGARPTRKIVRNSQRHQRAAVKNLPEKRHREVASHGLQPHRDELDARLLEDQRGQKLMIGHMNATVTEARTSVTSNGLSTPGSPCGTRFWAQGGR